MSIGSQYAQQKAKTGSYTLLVSDDLVNFVLTGAPATATLPLAAQCTQYPNGKNRKMIINGATSNDVVTIAVQSGNTLIGTTVLNPGETA